MSMLTIIDGSYFSVPYYKIYSYSYSWLIFLFYSSFLMWLFLVSVVLVIITILKFLHQYSEYKVLANCCKVIV